MGFCSSAFKCLLLVLNILFLVAAAFVIYVGIAYIFANYGSFAQVIGKPAIILVCAAGVLVLAGMIGCFGAFCEKKSCLGLFLMFLVTVAIVQASVGGILLTYRATSKQSYDSYVWDQFTQYGNDTCGSSVANSTFNATDFIDKVQQKDECCGFNNYSDWMQLEWGKNMTVPTSCCNSTETNNTIICTGDLTDKGQLHLIYRKGCKVPLEEHFYHWYDILTYAAIALAVLLFAGSLIVGAFLIRKWNEPFGYSRMSPAYTQA